MTPLRRDHAGEPPAGVELLRLDRCAVLDTIPLPASVPRPAPRPGTSSSVVPSFGFDQLIADAPVALDANQATAGALWPAEAIVTSSHLEVRGDGRTRTWDLSGPVHLIHSVSEPCTAVLPDGADHCDILVVPPSAVEELRLNLEVAQALRQRGDAAALAADDRADQAPPDAPTLRVDAVTAQVDVVTVLDRPAGESVRAVKPRRLRPGVLRSDQLFRGGVAAGGVSVLAIMALVGLFLVARAFHALQTTGLSFLTTSEWSPDSHKFGIAAVLSGTVFIALVALSFSVPLATGTALFISEVAPRRLKNLCVAMVDLMAAVPSIVYGLWGFKYLQGHVIGVARWLSTWVSWIPIFKVNGADPTNPLASPSVYTASTFIAGLVVALMVVPISCSIMREVFSQAPLGEREGAYALGATRWGMIRSVVLPFGRGGMIGAVMLGLGRALGETIAVYLIISPVFTINWHVLQSGSNSVSSLIVLRVGDASGFGLSALMAAGLALFVLTLIVNFTASAVVNRSRSGALSEA